LKEVDLRKGECKLHNCGLAVNNPGDNLVLRPLCSDDYEKGESALICIISNTKCSLSAFALFVSSILHLNSHCIIFRFCNTFKSAY